MPTKTDGDQVCPTFLVLLKTTAIRIRRYQQSHEKGNKERLAEQDSRDKKKWSPKPGSEDMHIDKKHKWEESAFLSVNKRTFHRLKTLHNKLERESLHRKTPAAKKGIYNLSDAPLLKYID